MTIREQAIQYIEQNKISQVHFGKLVGMGESTISRWLKGTYPSPEKMDAKVKDFLEKEAVRETITETKDIRFTMTAISKQIIGALEYGRIQRTISVVYGDAGIGKTRTMREWAADKTDVIIVTANPAVKSPKGFFKLLAKRLKTTAQGSIDDIVMDIMDKLAVSDRTIIIDEAQHLVRETLELVRSINDATGTAIILMGNEVVYAKMLGRQQAEFAQLFTRIGMRKHLLTDYFTENDVRAIFGVTEQGETDYLLSLCRSKFSLRGAIHVYVNAQNNEDTSEKGLKAMSKAMGIVV
ncbi:MULTISPECIES: AAA family ATPase [Lysinibacillus]|uniref:AAA family ATPase n=1 Tax=Lysinibacillus TaxID=400634 RepID=UPI002896C1D8|nr:MULTISPECIES: AAA family ATPase [Lysinibacillus]MED3799981.1 AAA family ATPase [Lysinibacillus capsici]